MTHLDALLREVLDRPHDDAPRLLYADEIDETDPERAEWIRDSLYLDAVRRADGGYSIMVPRTAEQCREWKRLTTKEKNDLSVKLCEKLFPLPATIQSIIVRRGWPAEITTTMRQFMGGEGPIPCKKCGGSGRIVSAKYQPISLRVDDIYQSPSILDSPHYTHHYCEKCRASGNVIGRIPGLVDTICGKWPITKIRITGKEPANGVFPRRGWYWETDSPRQTTNDYWEIPRDLFDKLNGYTWEDRRSLNIRFNQRHYDDRQAALDALSAAAVSLGRERAGLRPVTPTPAQSPRVA